MNFSTTTKDIENIKQGLNCYSKFYSGEISDRKSLNEIEYRSANSLAKIAKDCISYGSFKDHWNYDFWSHTLFGPELIIKSLKTESSYHLGISDSGIYLRSELYYSHFLHYMNDDFWYSILKLAKKENVEFSFRQYEENTSSQTDKYPHLFADKKSVVFQIIRKYLFDEINDDDNYRPFSVGEFNLSHSYNTDLETIVMNCCTNFKSLYNLNYKLWKASKMNKKITR